MIRAINQPCEPPDLLTEAEAIQYLRLDALGSARPDLALRRYRSRRGGYLLKSVRISGKTLYRLSDLQGFVGELQRRQDPSEALAVGRGRRRGMGVNQ